MYLLAYAPAVLSEVGVLVPLAAITSGYSNGADDVF